MHGSRIKSSANLMVAIVNTCCAINPVFTSINNEESSWLHQPHKRRLKITHLNFLKASLLKKSPYRFKSLLKVSNGKAGRCHWWSASCTSLLRIYPSDGIERVSPRHLSIDLSRHHLENDHGWKLRQASFFLQQCLQLPSKRRAKLLVWVQFFAAWVAANSSRGR